MFLFDLQQYDTRRLNYRVHVPIAGRRPNLANQKENHFGYQRLEFKLVWEIPPDLLCFIYHHAVPGSPNLVFLSPRAL